MCVMTFVDVMHFVDVLGRIRKKNQFQIDSFIQKRINKIKSHKKNIKAITLTQHFSKLKY